MIDLKNQIPFQQLDWKGAELTTHPQGGFTISVPIIGTGIRLYIGDYTSHRTAKMALTVVQVDPLP